MRRVINIRHFTVLTAVLLAVPVMAQTSASASGSTSSLKGHDTSAPIDVIADRIEVHDADKQAIFSGRVTIRQTGMTLDADTVKVFYSQTKSESPEISRLDADGKVKLVTATETATGRYGIYDVTRKAITLVGNVVLTRGGSVLNGQRLAIDLASGRSTLDGAAGATKPGDTAPAGGRVTGRFVVPQRTATKP
jgi:lipopolysaccharide export system protein LptA